MNLKSRLPIEKDPSWFNENRQLEKTNEFAYLNYNGSLYDSVFQPFSSRGTSQKFLIIWQNLNAPYTTIFREPSKELAEPLGSVESRLKNTALLLP